jgi:hypothetical protein
MQTADMQAIGDNAFAHNPMLAIERSRKSHAH